MAKADHWPQWDKPRFAATVQNLMGEYLKTAFGVSFFTISHEKKLTLKAEKADCAAAVVFSRDLAGVKCTIDPKGAANDSDSDSYSDDDESSEDDLDDDEESDEERDWPKKKKKVANAPTRKNVANALTTSSQATSSSTTAAPAVSTSSTPRSPEPRPLTYEELCTENIAHLKPAQDALRLAISSIMQLLPGEGTAAPAPVQARWSRKKPAATGPLRRSAHGCGEASGTDIKMNTTLLLESSAPSLVSPPSTR
ncbi:hypothetical protein B0H17DRAFT_1154690 [Mycena rosella]|uniref:Uncharacterized protein n=1 Tax=Mycena rosella TaxID=1033263 RepID=A0AAD7AXX4_MYCRO|nr:hypothetical protein B0H17DRAFT_1154690 [Mycena rosella]